MKKIGWIAFLLVVVYFIFVIRQDIIYDLQLRRDLRTASEKLSGEEKAAVDLKSRARRMGDGSLTEELARTRLGLVKKGEIAYKVVR
jgi:cell division protein FtsB